MPLAFRVATYNVHRCRGFDRQTDVARIAKVLLELNADLVCLQEVMSAPQSPELDQPVQIARLLGREHYHHAENWRRSGSGYGTMTLSRWPFAHVENHNISWREPLEPRGCLRTDIAMDGALVHVFNLHLGLTQEERAAQTGLLMSKEILRSPDLTGPRIVAGDFNDWKHGIPTQTLSHEFSTLHGRKRLRTFPALLPMFALDTIYYDAVLHLQTCRIHRSRTAALASDHLPVIAEFS